jgi:hypothetical protein
MTDNKIEVRQQDSTWVMRITADRLIEVNEGVDVTDAAKKVLEAMQLMLDKQKRTWVELTDEDLEFWTKELGQGELGRGVLRAVADHLKEKNT